MDTEREKGAKISGLLTDAIMTAGARAREFVTKPLARSATDVVLNGIANSSFYLIKKLRSDMTNEEKVQEYLNHFQASVERDRQ